MTENEIIAKNRISYLLKKTNSIDGEISYLEKQKFLFSCGVTGDFDSKYEIVEKIADMLFILNDILAEIRFLRRMLQLDFPICLN